MYIYIYKILYVRLCLCMLLLLLMLADFLSGAHLITSHFDFLHIPTEIYMYALVRFLFLSRSLARSAVFFFLGLFSQYFSVSYVKFIWLMFHRLWLCSRLHANELTQRYIGTQHFVFGLCLSFLSHSILSIVEISSSCNRVEMLNSLVVRKEIQVHRMEDKNRPPTVYVIVKISKFCFVNRNSSLLNLLPCVIELCVSLSLSLCCVCVFVFFFRYSLLNCVHWVNRRKWYCVFIFAV